MISKLQHYFTQVIRGKKRGVISSIMKAVAWVASGPYRLVAAVRNWAFDHEWLRQYDSPVQVVISVGNIVAGGSGKTPVTQLIASRFYEEKKIAILSRGYRSPAEELNAPVILSSGKGPLHSAAYAGDEPCLLAENLPKAWVVVGRERIQSANLVAKQGVDLILLDDGMQHRQIARDYEVVVLDSEDPFGHGYFLPRGFLRESPRGLGRADLIILNHVKSTEAFKQAKVLIEPYTTAPVVGIHYDGWKIYNLEKEEVSELIGLRVALFCGIAQPDRFVSTIRDMGAEVVAQKFFPDHFYYSTDELYELAKRWKEMGAEAMVCTEKDKIKLPELTDFPLPVYWIKILPRVVEGEEYLDQFIENIKQKFISHSVEA